MIILIVYLNLKSAIKVNKDVLVEYERLKQNDLFSKVKENAISIELQFLFII